MSSDVDLAEADERGVRGVGPEGCSASTVIFSSDPYSALRAPYPRSGNAWTSGVSAASSLS